MTGKKRLLSDLFVTRYKKVSADNFDYPIREMLWVDGWWRGGAAVMAVRTTRLSAGWYDWMSDACSRLILDNEDVNIAIHGCHKVWARCRERNLLCVDQFTGLSRCHGIIYNNSSYPDGRWRVTCHNGQLLALSQVFDLTSFWRS